MRVRSPYDEPVRVPALRNRVVNPGQVVDIPPDQLPSFVAARWEPADDAAKKAAKNLADAAVGEQSAPAPAGREG